MGWEERINDSLQQVHSKPCSQMTGMRGLVSMAATTWVTPAGPKPRAVAVSVQKRKKLRRSREQRSWRDPRRPGGLAPQNRRSILDSGKLSGIGPSAFARNDPVALVGSNQTREQD